MWFWITAPLDIKIMELARSTSKIVDKISSWFIVRLDYYVEAKEWEVEQRNHSFPEEWFEDN
jgi:hypothetical protein